MRCPLCLHSLWLRRVADLALVFSMDMYSPAIRRDPVHRSIRTRNIGDPPIEFLLLMWARVLEPMKSRDAEIVASVLDACSSST